MIGIRELDAQGVLKNMEERLGGSWQGRQGREWGFFYNRGMMIADLKTAGQIPVDREELKRETR